MVVNIQRFFSDEMLMADIMMQDAEIVSVTIRDVAGDLASGEEISH